MLRHLILHVFNFTSICKHACFGFVFLVVFEEQYISIHVPLDREKLGNRHLSLE